MDEARRFPAEKSVFVDYIIKSKSYKKAFHFHGRLFFVFSLNSFFEHIYHVQLFPRQIQIGSAEVTISRYLLIDGSSQIEVFDDCRRAQVEVFLYDFCDFFIGKLPCAIGIYQNGNGLCHADCVSKLYLTFSCNAAGNNIFFATCLAA